MARAINAGELTKLRGANQASILALAIPTPATVVQFALGSLPAAGNIAELAVTVDSGTYTNALADQTIIVYNSAKTAVKGVLGVRKTPAATALYVREISSGSISFAVGDKLVVVDDFCPHAKHVRTVTETTWYMDYDVAYSAQHSNPDPIVCMGPDAVVYLTGASADVDFDATASSVIIGSIASYAWAVSGTGATIANETTATPTVTVTVAGTARVSCTITTAAGASFTGYRYVYTYTAASPPITTFELTENPRGDWSQGGWSFGVTMLDNALKTEIRDRAKVILWAPVESFAGTAGSIGPVTDRENIICVGWIAGETIQRDDNEGPVSFEVHGAQRILSLADAYPCGLRDTQFAGATGTVWTDMADLNVDRGLWHALHWRSTVTRCMDVVLTGNTWQAGALQSTDDKFWAQLMTLAQATIMAQPFVDRFGRLYIQRNQHHLDATERNALPTVMSLTTADYSSLDIERRALNKYSRVNLSGVYYLDGDEAPIGAYSPGEVPYIGEENYIQTELVMPSQVDAGAWAGAVFGSGAGELSEMDVVLEQNNRFFDCAPQQWGSITLAAGDTERGVAGTWRLIPRSIELQFDAEAGFMNAEISFEPEGSIYTYTNQTFPGNGEEEPGGTGGGGQTPPEPPTPPNEPPPEAPPVPGEVVVSTAGDVRTTGDITAGTPAWTTEY